MRIAEFLTTRIYGAAAPRDVQQLDRLAGHAIGDTRLDATMEEAAQRVSPWMPLYCLPAGEYGGFRVAIHLRPEDVAAKRCAWLHLQGETAMVEISGSVEHLAFLSLAFKDGAGSPPKSFAEEVSFVQEVLGAAAYRPGAYGEFRDDEAQDVAARERGPSVDFYLSGFSFAPDEERKLSLLKEGIALEPGCMAFYSNLVRLHMEQDRQEQAAEVFARSLACYHHTAYAEDLDEYYELGRTLLGRFPDKFSDFDRKDLETTDEKRRFKWMTELYEDGKVELATKVLCDMCHERQDYESVLPIFRKHFEKLGWSWALALCDFRAGNVS